MKKILVLLGPNLNLTGVRRTDIYGEESFEDINSQIRECAQKSGFEAYIIQSNHEGVLIDEIQKTLSGEYVAAIINAGAYTHYSYAIRDAIECTDIPFIEVHMSDISKREDFRRVSVIKDVCACQIMGLGKNSYFAAIDKIKKLTQEKNHD